MKFFETSKYYTLKKSTYISLRWIGTIGQLISINLVFFYFNFKFDVVYANLTVFFGILSNLFLIFIYKKTQLSDRSALIFLIIDIMQLGILLYLTGGTINPFVIFLLIPTVFASSNLGLRTNILLVIITTIIITIRSTTIGRISVMGFAEASTEACVCRASWLAGAWRCLPLPFLAVPLGCLLGP